MIEIMVVIVIVGILAALAVPRFNTYTGESQLDGDAQGIFLDMQWMRSQALLTRQKHIMTFSTTTVDGSTRLAWNIYQVDAAGTTLTPRKASHSGITVELGLPTGVSAPATSSFPVFTSGFGTGTDGLRAGLPTTTQCVGQIASGAYATDASETWVGGIAACGGATSDMETGVLYLRTSRSTKRAYALVFNRNADLGLKRFRYMGGTWSAI